MKFTIDNNLVKSAITQISGGLGTGTLGSKSVYIEVEGDTVTFMTNNYKVGYQFSTTDVNIEEEGTILVDGPTLNTFVSAARNEEVGFSYHTETSSLIIEDGTRKVRIQEVADATFPKPVIAEERIATLSLGTFKHYLKSLIPISATNGMATDGIYLNGSSIIATNGEQACMIIFNNELEESLVFTRDAAREITKIAIDDDVDLYKSGNFLSLIIESGAETLKMSIQLVEDNYPDIAGLVENYEANYEFEIPVHEFLDEVSYAALVSDNKNQVCSLEIYDDVINLTANAGVKSSTVKTYIPCQYLTVGFDAPAKYVTKIVSLQHVLKAIKDYVSVYGDDSDILLSYVGPTSAVKLQIEGVIGFVSAITIQ